MGRRDVLARREVTKRPGSGRAVGMLLLVVACCAAAGAQAQAYPSKPVRLILPFPPGGGTDVVGRLLAQKLGQALGQQVIVDNRAGAGGRIGTDLVAKSPPDGYTLLLATSSVMGTGPALYQKLPFDMPKDFAPVSLVAYTAYVLVAHPSVPATSVKGLLALAKSRPGQLTFASSGAGGASHLSGELFSAMAGVKMVHVAYKGSSPGMFSVVSGETDLMFNNALPALPQVKNGRLRALAVTTPLRSALLPEVPTVAESGLQGFEVQQNYGVLAPAGTPREIVGRLNREIGKVMQTDDAKSRLLADGSEAKVSTPQEFEKVIIGEIEKWSKVIKQAGIKEE
jgi:tripartite-type tricarboxylate transporter receptor subunit TctC